MLLIEAAAQLAGVVGQTDPHMPALEGLRLTAVGRAKILGAARPGELIQLSARVTGRMGNLIQASATAAVGGRVLLQADLTLSGTLPPNYGLA